MMIRGAVIEGPVWDAKFYGEWLLAAAQADTLWKECLSDPDFENKVSRIGVRSNPDFGITAIVMLNWLGGRRPRFVINVDGDEGEDFVLMAGMGFFIPKYQTYQMAVPSGLAVETVRMALSDYAKTEDDEGLPHPESLLTTMPYGEAIALQTRLRAIDDFRDDAGLGSFHEA